MAALHADGSVDISIPGVGIYPRVARSAVRLLNGAPAPAFALMVDMVAPRFGEASKPASVLREQGYPPHIVEMVKRLMATKGMSSSYSEA